MITEIALSLSAKTPLDSTAEKPWVGRLFCFRQALMLLTVGVFPELPPEIPNIRGGTIR